MQPATSREGGGRPGDEIGHSIRRAHADEAGELSALALRSKAFWGYDPAFMAACCAELTLAGDDVRDNPAFLLERAGQPIGFYTLEPLPAASGDAAELGMFFIDPPFIGQRLGGLMLRDAVTRATGLGMRRLVVQSDPHAEGFYRAAGFVRVGCRASGSVPGRDLPVLVRDLEETASP